MVGGDLPLLQKVKSLILYHFSSKKKVILRIHEADKQNLGNNLTDLRNSNLQGQFRVGKSKQKIFRKRFFNLIRNVCEQSCQKSANAVQVHNETSQGSASRVASFG